MDNAVTNGPLTRERGRFFRTNDNIPPLSSRQFTLANYGSGCYTETMKWFNKIFSPLVAFIGIQMVWVVLVIS